MREAGVLKFDLLDLLASNKAYIKHTVYRNNTWVFESGKPVYELINKDNEIFIMQSFSTQKIEQTPESLSKLGTTLQLPKGWSFRTRVLKNNAYLTPLNKKAVVIQDNNLNTYQKETPSFIDENSN